MRWRSGIALVELTWWFEEEVILGANNRKSSSSPLGLGGQLQLRVERKRKRRKNTFGPLKEERHVASAGYSLIRKFIDDPCVRWQSVPVSDRQDEPKRFVPKSNIQSLFAIMLLVCM